MVATCTALEGFESKLTSWLFSCRKKTQVRMQDYKEALNAESVPQKEK